MHVVVRYKLFTTYFRVGRDRIRSLRAATRQAATSAVNPLDFDNSVLKGVPGGL